MAKLSLVLLAVLVLAALATVRAQHQARKFFTAYERAQSLGHELDVEYGRLQLEASTWALHARIERIAAESLGMRAPDARHVRSIVLPAGAKR